MCTRGGTYIDELKIIASANRLQSTSCKLRKKPYTAIDVGPVGRCVYSTVLLECELYGTVSLTHLNLVL